MKLLWKIATLLTGVLFGILASLIATRALETHFLGDKVALSALDVRDNEASKYEPQLNTQKKIASAILIDSILTIIQNYYVDRAKSLDNTFLIKSTLAQLSNYKNFKTDWESDSTVRVEIKNFVFEFDIEAEYSFQSLLEDAVNLSSFIGKSKLVEELNYDDSELNNAGAFIFLNALLKSLDPHSGLLDKEEYRELKQGTEGAFGGLGVVVGIENDLLKVIKPLPRSPAEKAGINGDDQIIFINDVSTFGTSLQNLVHHMRGAPGTEVNLSLLRDSDDAPRKVKIRREIIQVDSITPKIIESKAGNILSLAIDSFSSRTSDEIKEAVNKYLKSHQVQSLVLDLRGNPGGLLDQAVKSADLFLKSGRIVSTSGRRPEVEVAFDDGDEIDLPVVILVDGDTASASEILSGALQDNNRAIVVGQPTFGKGSVQTVFELPSNQALKLTIAKYYSPSGRVIQNVGIMPDIWSQPVYKSRENINLLGQRRYGGEKFLVNTLVDELDGSASAARHKFYYLNESELDYQEILAKEILVDLFDKNQSPLKKEKMRATYWMASSSGYLNMKSEFEDEKILKYLSENHQIKWNSVQGERVTSPLRSSFTVLGDGSLSVKEGERVHIKWEIENHSDRQMERVSIYLRSNEYGIPTIEELVGTIPSGEKVQGELSVRVALEADDQPYTAKLGMAVDSWPNLDKQNSVSIKVTPSSKPKLTYDVSLVDEKGGKSRGVLEPGESAALEVTVKNESAFKAKEVNVTLANLSGKQISINSSANLGLVDLANGKVKKFRFPIRVSSKLISKQIHLGLIINSSEYLVPLRDNHLIIAEPVTNQ